MAKKNRKQNTSAENVSTQKGANVLTTPVSEERQPRNYRSNQAQRYSIYDDAVAPGDSSELT